jgi:hypothetical protein
MLSISATFFSDGEGGKLFDVEIVPVLTGVLALITTDASTKVQTVYNYRVSWQYYSIAS